METSTSMWHFSQRLGYTNRSSGNYRTIRQNLDRRGLTIPRWLKTGKSTRKQMLEEICTKNSTYDNKELKKRLVTENVFEYKCSICNVTSWQGQPISLQLDHMNGDNTDQRLDNLRFLCPNCHSQTSTWGNKKRTK